MKILSLPDIYRNATLQALKSLRAQAHAEGVAPEVLDALITDLTPRPPPEPTVEGEHYWRTVVCVEVLTRGAEPPEITDLAALHDLITQGSASGDFVETSEPVTEGEMRKLLENQGSDPGFLIREDRDGTFDEGGKDPL